MYFGKIIFSQIIDHLPMHTFRRCVNRYHGHYKVKHFSCWDQYLCMVFAQLTYRESLRDIQACLRAQQSKLYHIGIRGKVSLNTLANADKVRDWRIYADLAQSLIHMARRLYSHEDFGVQLDETVYALDATTIDLCLSVFPWAHFRQTKAAIKLHTLLDLRGNIPTFIHISDGKLHDVNVLDKLLPEPGAFYIMDRGYLDFERLHTLSSFSAFFVIRAKSNLKFRRLYSHPIDKTTGLRCDQTIVLTGFYPYKRYPAKLRRVKYYDSETHTTFVFLTNNFILPALTITQLYKCRWQVRNPEGLSQTSLPSPGSFLLESKGGRRDMSNAASGLAHLKPFLPGLEPLLEDAEVSEIMINGPGNVWIEARGRLTAHAAPGLDESALLRAAIHIARPLGLDPATTPIIDARLDDGSRVAICVPPASPHVAITIRRFGKRTFSAVDLVEQKALPENVLEAAAQMLMTRRNILVSGGTGSGKTTLLNALIELLPVDERIVAIEDTLELRIDHSNCVRFKARGLQEGAVMIRDLVRHALRHRPDHIVVGEVRGGEAADLLQALNTGHGGSLTTVHANNAESALSRIASCAMQGGGELPWEVTCRGVVDGIAMVIHMTRSEGRRFVEEAAYVKGYDAKENKWDIERLERISLTN